MLQAKLPVVDRNRLARVLGRQRKQHSKYFGIGRPANETILYGPVSAILNATFPEDSLYRPMPQYTLEDEKRDQRELLRPDFTVVTDAELVDDDSDALTCLVIEVKNKPLSAKDRQEDTRKAVDQLYRYMIDAFSKRSCTDVLYGIAIVGFRMYLYKMRGGHAEMTLVDEGFAPNFLDNTAVGFWMLIRDLVDEQVCQDSLAWPRTVRSRNNDVGMAWQDADMERSQDTMDNIFEDAETLKFPPRPEPKDLGAATYLAGLSPANTDSTGHHEIESHMRLRSARQVGETLSYIPFFDSPASSNLSSEHRVSGTPCPSRLGGTQHMSTPQPGRTPPFDRIRSMLSAQPGGMPFAPGAPSDFASQPAGTPSSSSPLMPPWESPESPLDRFSKHRRQRQTTGNVVSIGNLMRDQDQSSGTTNHGQPEEDRVPRGGTNGNPSYAAGAPRTPEPVGQRAITDWHAISASQASSISSQPHNSPTPDIAPHSRRHFRGFDQSRRSSAQTNHPDLGGG
ncbi:uncharacterized protein EI90DRAFT_3039161 [Cantharellus anzutake]|uniref:uncharacterized protein n=1 Tax=Cantharellus anzutake TaxID=1750568 RepID=UPI0019078464|nr:uncharacterized protein EI90DRAFT_3039161 [Cantharellus anzutake]KAF8338785.1 hypothetical protein EI90DRAFT_3039161 [Cantharellus anzutake]